MINIHVNGAGVLRGFVGDHPAGVIILLPQNRIGRRDDEPQPAAFHQTARDEQAGREFAFHDLAVLNQRLLTQRFTIPQPADVGPERDTGSVWFDFVEIGREIGVGRVNGNPKRDRRATDQRRFVSDKPSRRCRCSKRNFDPGPLSSLSDRLLRYSRHALYRVDRT